MMHELKPITTKRRTLGWKPTITMRMPGGTLTFNDDETREGLFAYGKRHDYWVWMEGTLGHVGRWSEGALYETDALHPCHSLQYATVPNATTNQLIRLAEEWEADQ